MKQRIQAPKRAGRKDREHRILINLVEHYIRSGRPVGSNTLQEMGFADISSATIRNYFVSLEQEGFLVQQHTSGGRIPLPKAFIAYATHCHEEFIDEQNNNPHTSGNTPKSIETDAVVSLVQQMAHKLSQQTSLAVAVSAPRFDHDVITSMHFIFIDINRALAILITEFGLVHTHVISSPFALSHSLLQQADLFAKTRLFQDPAAIEIPPPEAVQFLYREAVASYVVSHSSISQEDIWKTGFSQLLRCSSFEDSLSLTAPLSLFENTTALRTLLRKAMKSKHLQFWIADELSPYVIGEPNCACIAMPYFVGNRPVGAICVVGSMRLFYKEIFSILKNTSTDYSALLTSCFVHHRISYRMAESHTVLLQDAKQMSTNFQNPSANGSV